MQVISFKITLQNDHNFVVLKQVPKRGHTYKTDLKTAVGHAEIGFEGDIFASSYHGTSRSLSA